MRLATDKGAFEDIGPYDFAPKLRLARNLQGAIRLSYIYRPGVTNSISASTNLLDWLSLGTQVADHNGVFELQDDSASALPLRFYRVRLGSGPIGISHRINP